MNYINRKLDSKGKLQDKGIYPLIKRAYIRSRDQLRL